LEIEEDLSFRLLRYAPLCWILRAFEEPLKMGSGPMEEITMNIVVKAGLLAGCLILLDAPHEGNRAHVAPVVALDECDPATFNAPNAVGPDFCRNIALGAATTFSDLFAQAQSGKPNPNWDFEPDKLTIEEGTDLNVVDQGGEPHTFTEVAHFGGGFIPGLNGPGEDVVPECAAGFSSVAVAKTRILQGSQSYITGLSKGKHYFQCCIHPWMRMEVDVK
jgi:plastocyanin